MRILYLGPPEGTCLQRARALERAGHDVTLINPNPLVPEGRVRRKLHYETGGILCERVVTRRVLEQVRQLGPTATFDLTWVDNGRYVGPSLIKALRKAYGPVLNYNHDDPYGWRDRFSWSLYRKSVPHYDLLVVVRRPNIEEAKARGAKDVMLVWRPADEVAHSPRVLTDADRAEWASDVLFVGTWFPERGPLMRDLIALGVPLSIYGERWERAPEWEQIKPAWKGPPLNDPEKYARAIQCSKISLGLVSKGNRDLHTTRSSEIPAIGALFCAQRTTEHREMYTEGVEAVFWDNAAECAAICKKLLADDELRERIRVAGFERVRKNASFNEPMMTSVIERVISNRSAG